MCIQNDDIQRNIQRNISLIREKIKEVTPIVPMIYIREYNNILIAFKGTIPSEEEILQISEILDEFGEVYTNNCRPANFISLLLVWSQTSLF